jgi:hypothetical protein
VQPGSRLCKANKHMGCILHLSLWHSACRGLGLYHTALSSGITAAAAAAGTMHCWLLHPTSCCCSSML